ncbi:MAG: hypothetical protein GY952_18610 [Rhodobacteraceae bacterium]|nr:hypothetical protein [Paracoccaceae bacterium]
MTNLTLRIQADDLTEPRLQDLTRSLRADLLKYTDAEVDFPQAKAEAHQKGDVISIGTLLISAMTSGTAVALFDMLKAYFDRNKGIKIKLQRADGTEMEIDATTAKAAEPMIHKFLGTNAE